MKDLEDDVVTEIRPEHLLGMRHDNKEVLLVKIVTCTQLAYKAVSYFMK
jgi:hypothetical protein